MSISGRTQSLSANEESAVQRVHKRPHGGDHAKPAQRVWVWVESPCCRTHHRRHIHSHISSRFCIVYLFPSQELPKSPSSKVRPRRCSNLTLAHTHPTDQQDGDTNYDYGSDILHCIPHIHIFARSRICSRLYP